MKHILTTFIVLLASIAVFSQAPQQFNYQAIARDLAGQPLADQNIGIRISILEGDINGSTSYQEIHLVQTSGQGLFNLSIGGGSAVIGDMTDVDWGLSTHFLQTEIDADGGSNYELLGTSQLLSVPYALHANTSRPQELSIDGNELSISGGNSVEISGGESLWTLNQNSISYEDGPIYLGGNEGILDDYGQSIDGDSEINVVAPQDSDISLWSIYSNNLTNDGFEYILQTDFNHIDGGVYYKHVFTDGSKVGESYVDPYNIRTQSLRVSSSINTGSLTTESLGNTEPIDIQGDLYFFSNSNVARGLIFKSPNGKCWKQTVDDNGSFQSEEVSCPN